MLSREIVLLSPPSGTFDTELSLPPLRWSTAAKDGTPTPGVGGHMHGLSWYLPLQPSDVVGPMQLPINWLEFLAVYGNFVIFGPSVLSPVASFAVASVD